MIAILVNLGVVALALAFIVTAFIRKSFASKVVQLLFVIASLLGLVGVTLFFTTTHESIVTILQIQQWSFQMDSWSAFFALIVNGGLLITSLYGGAYLEKYKEKYSSALVNGATAIFALAMIAVLFSSTVFSFLFFWEAMSLSAYFLVIADREELSLSAGRLYIVMTHIGFLCILAGFLILSNGNLTSSFSDIAEHAMVVPHILTAVAFFLFLAGFGSKAGLVPLHQWLPHAHPQAPSHSSALLSGVMLNIALYGFVRTSFSFFYSIPIEWAVAVVVIGLVSAVFGVLYASVEKDLKRLLAWSSIENLGLTFSAIGLSMLFTSLGSPLLAILFVAIALIHAFNHAFFKIGLFLSAGSIISETHTRDIDRMGGLAQKWPWFSKVFFGLMLAAAALPPLGTFYGEWLYVQGIASSLTGAAPLASLFFILVLAVIALVGGLAIFTFVKVFSIVFLGRARSAEVENVKNLPKAMIAPIAGTVIILAVTGLFASSLQKLALMAMGAPTDIVNTLMQGAISNIASPTIDFASSVSVSSLVITLAIIIPMLVLFLFQKTTFKKGVRVTDTWDCGQTITPRMQYTATGFAAPIRFFFRSILMVNKSMEATPVVSTNPWITQKVMTAGIQSVWDEWVYKPMTKGVIRLAHKVKLVQSGIIQLYLLFILVVLILVLILAL